MKYSYAWLRALSGTQKEPEELARVLTVRAFEVEDIDKVGTGFKNVVVGQVRTKVKHPNADRLSVAQVDVGEGELRTIVCGAPNLAEGQKVPVALPGAVLPTSDGKGFAIRKGKIRGIESNGMICAEDELGLGDDHEGIMVLPDDAPIGMPFAQYMELDDTAIEIDILPNRAHDCLSHEGVAREIAAIEGRGAESIPLTTECTVPSHNTNGENVVVKTDACDRYTATFIEGVDNTVQTPQWMRARLMVCGIRSINPLVDITNYVMLQTGQPLHVFDKEYISGAIAVRMGATNEKVVLLDGTTLTVTKNDIVIADDEKVLAFAGVMGGKESGVTSSTKNVILECAHFDGTIIRKTCARHSVMSDAAYRFERDPSPVIVAHAQAQAVALIKEICGGTLKSVRDVYPVPVAPQKITLSQTYVTKLLGIDILQKESAQIFTRLGIAVSHDGDNLVCTVPPVRRDLATPEDLIEEIGRLYGLENIPPRPLKENVVVPPINENRIFEHRTRDIFVAGGFDEVKSYSFYSVDDARIMGLDENAHVKLLNPMSAEQTLMRRTLAPALMRACARNYTHTDTVHIFEVGRIYEPTKNDLPHERRVLACAVLSKHNDARQFFSLKSMIDAYLDTLGIEGCYYSNDYKDDARHIMLHPSRHAVFYGTDKTPLGLIGEITKKQAKYFGIKNARVAYAEIDMNSVQKALKKEVFFEPLSKYPTVSRDLSMIVGARTRVADVERVLYDTGGVLLKDVDLFDLYVNNKTGERSMAFHCIFGAPDRTLTSKEVDKIIVSMIDSLEKSGEISVKK